MLITRRTATTERISTNTSTEHASTGSYTLVDDFPAPKLRARTIVLSAIKLKPFTTMNVFLSGINVNSDFVPCTKVEITSTGTFYGSTGIQRNDNILLRATAINSYDTILLGDVITCVNGSAVVVADEIIHDKVAGTNKRVLYVTNIKGSLSGTITGSVSLSTGVVVSVAAGDRTTNSLGNFYGALVIPSFTFDSGIHKILLSDDITPDPNASSTSADASYSSNGNIVTHTTHNTSSERSVTTVVDRTTTTWYHNWPGHREDN